MKINKETYYRLIELLNSNDEENAIVAFEIIKQASLTENVIQIMLLYSNSRRVQAYWSQHANEKFKFLSRMDRTGAGILSYPDIFRQLKLFYSKDVTIEDLELLFECYAKELLYTANNIVSGIEEVQIKLITNGHKSGTASQG